MKSLIRYHTKDHLKLFGLKLRYWLSNQPCIIIYTMAKVGSLSIYTAIRNQTNIPCFHLHTLNEAEENASLQQCFNQGLLPDSRSAVSFVANTVMQSKRKVQFITLFRNPIERNISAFFDAFELYVGLKPNEYKGTTEKLIELYHRNLPHLYAIEWFEKQFRRDTGINIYDYDFNQELGYQKISNSQFDVLLLNSSINDSLKESLIADFLSQKTIKLKNVNVTAESSKAKLYKDFKNTIKFKKEYLDQLLLSSYSQHFFTKDEIERTYKRWQEEV